MLSQKEVNNEEEVLRKQIGKLTNDERIDFFKKVKLEIKDPDTYATLNWFFITGLHHFYLKKWFNGMINLITFIIGITLIVIGEYRFGMSLIILISLIELWALFRSQIIVQNFNNKIYRKVLNSITKADN